MNLMMRDGYVWVNGQMAYPITPNLFCPGGVNIPDANCGCGVNMPNKQGFQDLSPDQLATIGKVHRTHMAEMLESLACRASDRAAVFREKGVYSQAFTALDEMCHILRGEKESWK